MQNIAIQDDVEYKILNSSLLNEKEKLKLIKCLKYMTLQEKKELKEFI